MLRTAWAGTAILAAQDLTPVVSLRRCCGLRAPGARGAICRRRQAKWNSVFKRFRRRVKADAFCRMFRALAEDADFEYAMVDGSIVKVHRHGQGAKGGLRARPSGVPGAA